MSNSFAVVDTARWSVRCAVVLDWHDGPRSGICALNYPRSEFEFSCICSRTDSRGMDHYLHSTAPLPEGTLNRLITILQPLGRPRTPVWVPIWHFASLDERQKAELQVDSLLSNRRQFNRVIYANTMDIILGCWDYEPTKFDADEIFDSLGIDV